MTGQVAAAKIAGVTEIDTTLADLVGPAARDAAWAAAAAAQAQAGVSIRSLTVMPELEAVQDLYLQIWRAADKNPPVSGELLRAMVKAGSYVAGAFDGEQLVGACVGFFAPPGQRALHSHIAGVSAVMRGRNVGFALKVHQRAWAMARGVLEVSWTFDPLIRRNAYFNLSKLGGDAGEYLPDFYGKMHDAINGDDDTDRLLIQWELSSVKAAQAATGHGHRAVASMYPTAAVALRPGENDEPVTGPSDTPVVLVGVPADIEAMRGADDAKARAWRRALREALGSLLSQGAKVTGFDPAGWYVVDREPH